MFLINEILTRHLFIGSSSFTVYFSNESPALERSPSLARGRIDFIMHSYSGIFLYPETATNALQLLEFDDEIVQINVG